MDGVALLPIGVINTIRYNVDIAIETFGFPCKLFIPKESEVDKKEKLDIYNEKPVLQDDYSFLIIESKVFMVWNPEMKALRRMGIFTEDELPIVAWLKNSAEGNSITRNSFIEIDINYVPSQYKTTRFELVDCLVKNAYNALVVSAWRCAPLRRQ